MLTQTSLKILLTVALNVLICSFCGIIALILLWQKKLLPFQDYALVVDAGSSHTKAFVYTWPADKSNGRGLTSRVQQVKSCSVPAGPITTIINPTDNNIQQYFNSSITDCINQIPLNRKDRALLFLGATAGLRLSEIMNSSYTNSMLNKTRNYFSSLGLRFRSPESQVRIISGTEEGLSGWITINFLMRQLFDNDKPMETYGVSDLGGASTQLSFIAPNASQERFTMNLFNTTYDVYSHSYLCYGQHQSRLTYLIQLIQQTNTTDLIYDPCLQPGYIQNMTYNELFNTPCTRQQYSSFLHLNKSIIFTFIGTGKYYKCRKLMKQRFNKSICTSQTCSFNDIYQPIPIPSSLKFVAIAAWYPVFKVLAPYLSLSPNKDNNYEFNNLTLSQIKYTIKTICNQPWRLVQSPDKYRPFLCFNSMLHWTLFEYGYSMTDENLKKFQIVKTLNSNEIGWTLGYMINQTNYLLPQYRPKRLLTQDEFIILLSLSIILFIISLIAASIAMYIFKKTRKH